MSDIVLLKDLAEEMGLDRSNMRKYVLKEGLQPFKVRTPETRGQKTLALSKEDAGIVRALRKEQGFLDPRPIIDSGEGWFYIIQLVPYLKPERVKLGFTNNVRSRLQAHRTAAPTAEVVCVWPCKKAWEIAAIDCIVQKGCVSIGPEVFDCENLDNLLERANYFFGVMPILEEEERKC